VNAAKPTVAELNDIQTQWMKLDPHAPDKEKNRVFALMKLYPRAYLSVDAAKANGSAMVDGCPVWASPRPIRDALRWLMDLRDHRQHPGVRTDVAWCGALEKWVDISEVMP